MIVPAYFPTKADMVLWEGKSWNLHKEETAQKLQLRGTSLYIDNLNGIYHGNTILWFFSATCP